MNCSRRCDRRLESLGRHVEQDHAARFQHVHVGVHAALRRQPRGIAPGPGGQRLNIVGEEPLKVGCTVLPSDRNLQSRCDGANGRVFLNRPVAVCQSHGV